MGFLHPGNAIQGPGVSPGDVVRVAGTKPPPLPPSEELFVGGMAETAGELITAPLPNTRRFRGGLAGIGIIGNLPGNIVGVGGFID
jgi:hypothetical protein